MASCYRAVAKIIDDDGNEHLIVSGNAYKQLFPRAKELASSDDDDEDCRADRDYDNEKDITRKIAVLEDVWQKQNKKAIVQPTLPRPSCAKPLKNADGTSSVSQMKQAPRQPPHNGVKAPCGQHLAENKRA